MFTHFDRIRNRRTDRRADIQTGIAPRHSPRLCIASCGHKARSPTTELGVVVMHDCWRRRSITIVLLFVTKIILRIQTAVVGAVEGGAVANLYAVLVARHRAQPNVKHKGLTNLPPLVVFQSDRVCSVYSYVLVTLTL